MKKAWWIIDQLIQQGVTRFSIAPGSRSTPLAVAAAEHPKAEKIVHFDERGCAFYALGYGKGASRPAAVIASSGTRNWIRQLEPFERGLYGGAVGWTTEGSSEWAAAIRCCLIRGKEVRLYTGTGIVEGSSPKSEWDELDLKMNLYDGIFA